MKASPTLEDLDVRALGRCPQKHISRSILWGCPYLVMGFIIRGFIWDIPILIFAYVPRRRWRTWTSGPWAGVLGTPKAHKQKHFMGMSLP